MKISELPKKRAKQQNLFAFLAKAPSNKPSKRTDVDVVVEDAYDEMQQAIRKPFSTQKHINDAAKETGNDIQHEMTLRKMQASMTLVNS